MSFRTSSPAISDDKIRAAIDATKAQLRAADADAVKAAQEDAQSAYEALLTDARPVIEAILDQEGFLVNDGNVHAIFNTLKHRGGLSPTPANVRAVMKSTGLIHKPEPSEAEVRAQIENEIASILSDVVIPETWSVYDKKAKQESIRTRLEHNRNRFASTVDGRYVVSTEAMAQELANLKNARAYRNLSHTELQAQVRGEREVPEGVAPVPQGMPILSPSISRHALAQYDADGIRKLIRAFDQKHGIGSGKAAVTARLSGADAAEIKRQYSI